MEGVRATGQHPNGKGHDQKTGPGGGPSKPQDSGNASPAQPQILSPKQAANAMVESGVNRHAQRIDVLFLKAVWGGIFLSYGGMFESVVGGVSDRVMTDWAGVIRMLEGLVFPVGLVMIVLSGTELLTSDMLFFTLAALKGRIPWWSVPYSLFVVFWGNLVGSLFFAGILAKYSALVNTASIGGFIRNATTTRVLTLEWHNLLCRGIGCNIMVCMSVYLAAMASDLFGKAVGVWIPLSTFVVLQFEHVVADMFTIPMGIILRTPGVSVGHYIWKTLLAALIGNYIGALLLGLSLYWFYLHDTTAPIVPRSARHDSDEERTVNGDSGAAGVGPGGKGTYGKGTKIQDIFRHGGGHHQLHQDFKDSNYERSHF